MGDQADGDVGGEVLISSSILAVAMGSSDEHGSSMSSTSGSTASARAMHNRCCCPPDSFTAGDWSRSFTRSHSAAWCSAASAASRRTDLDRTPLSRSPATTLSKMLMVGKGLGRWKTMPTRLRTNSAWVSRA